MSAKTWNNLAEMFFDQTAVFGDMPFLWKKCDGRYTALSWATVASKVTALSRCLLFQGIQPGDRVVLISENRPEWLISELAILSIGAITVPTYTTNTQDDHRHVLHDSGAKGGIVSTKQLSQLLLNPAIEAPEFKFILCMEEPNINNDSRIEVLSQNSLIKLAKNIGEDVIATAGHWQRTDTACIIYTSGTGGVPKGVMLSHGSILHNCTGALDALQELGLDHEVFLSFLPLSHSYEHMAGQFFPISIGAEIFYAEGVELLSANMLEAKPTIMTAVPRLYELMHQRIITGVNKGGRIKKILFTKTLEIGQRKYETQKLGLIDRILDLILDKLVRSKVRNRFGGRLKALVSGGAPLNPEIGIFFTSLGLRILQGYGQTEAAPLISVNRPTNIKMHAVGPPVLNTEIKIASDGEILVRGELVMKGYWRQQLETSKAIINGWLYTGDIGHLDEDGYLVITDRKKDIIVNSGGDNIAPQRIEGFLCLEQEIAQAMVYGDKHPHLVAVLIPDQDWVKRWAKKNNISNSLQTLHNQSDFHKAVGLAVSRVNEKLSNIEKIRHFLIGRELFSIKNKLLTPTMKIRRHMINKLYGEDLENLYH